MNDEDLGGWEVQRSHHGWHRVTQRDRHTEVEKKVIIVVITWVDARGVLNWMLDELCMSVGNMCLLLLEMVCPVY